MRKFRRGYKISWSWSYIWCRSLKQNSGPLEEEQNLFISDPSLQPQEELCHLLPIKVCPDRGAGIRRIAIVPYTQTDWSEIPQSPFIEADGWSTVAQLEPREMAQWIMCLLWKNEDLYSWMAGEWHMPEALALGICFTQVDSSRRGKAATSQTG